MNLKTGMNDNYPTGKEGQNEFAVFILNAASLLWFRERDFLTVFIVLVAKIYCRENIQSLVS